MLVFDDHPTTPAIDPVFAAWATSFLYGVASPDELLDAARVGLYIGDMSLWAQVRAHGEFHPDHLGPGVRLVMNGPGHMRGLADGLYVAGEPDGGIYRIAVGEITFLPDEELPLEPPLPAGQALLELGHAADQAATLIETLGFRSIQATPAWRAASAPPTGVARDLPPETPLKALRIFERARRITDIVTTVRANLGDTSLDPMLLPLAKALRQAYEAAIAAQAEEYFRD